MFRDQHAESLQELLWADTTVAPKKVLLVPLEPTTLPLKVPPPRFTPPFGLKSTTFSITAHSPHAKPNPPVAEISLCLTNVLIVKMPKPGVLVIWTSSMVPPGITSAWIPL